jgi:5-methylcytosine-specific restriction protein A
MTRAVPEWIADHDDQAIPRLVKARIWARCEGKCALTGRKLTPADKPEFDHIKPLADGGEHREFNLQLVGSKAHKIKTAGEADQRAKERSIHAKHFGYATPPVRKIAQHVDPWGKQRRRKAPSVQQGAKGGAEAQSADCEANSNTTTVEKAPQ